MMRWDEDVDSSRYLDTTQDHTYIYVCMGVCDTYQFMSQLRVGWSYSARQGSDAI